MFLASLLATAAVATATQPATNVTATGATLNGTVDGPATIFFQWGTSTGYGNSTPDQTVTASGPVSATLETLSAATTYHYRLVVNGAAQNDVTFTTAPNPQPPRVSDQRARDIGPGQGDGRRGCVGNRRRLGPGSEAADGAGRARRRREDGRRARRAAAQQLYSDHRAHGA